MQSYIVTARSVEIPEGIVALSPEQAATRRHHLESLGHGLFQVLRPVEFKVGEQFGFDGVMPKHFASAVEAVKGHKAGKAAAGKSGKAAAVEISAAE